MKPHHQLATWVLVILSVGAAASVADTVLIDDQTFYRGEWRASTFAVSSQHQAALDVMPDGRIVTVWSSRRQQDGRAGVYAQRFEPNGVALGCETAPGLWLKSHQTEPAVAVDRDGNTWMVWQSHGQDGQAGGIIARRFDADFVGGSEIAVNQHWQGHQIQPVIAVSPRGAAVIVWTSLSSAKDVPRLRGRVFDSAGKPLSDEFAVGPTAGRMEAVPSVAFAPDGSFAVAYGVFDKERRPAGIRFQRFSPAGQRLGDELTISGARKTSQIEPAIAATRDGFVAAWLDAESDGSDYGVLARRLDAEGRPLGDLFVVNTTRQGRQHAAAIAVARDGHFAMAWNSSDGDEGGVFCQVFNADGTRRGTEFRINHHTKGKQAMHGPVGTRRLVFNANDELLCVWSGDASLDDKSSVNVTMLAAHPPELAGRQQGVTPDMTPAGTALARADGPKPHEPPTYDPKLAAPFAERKISRDETFGFDAISNTGWTPPDPHLAVGPNHIVCMTNGAIAFFEKDGTLTFQEPIEDSFGFWGELGTSGFVFDPEVLYDEGSGRFFAMAAEAYAPPGSNHSYVLVAVSDDSDPNGTWYKHRFDTTTLAGNLFDSPNIGVDENVMYITGDGFGTSANYPVYTFDKPSLLAGSPPMIQKSTVFPTSTQSAGIPPICYGAPKYYMIEHDESSFGTDFVKLIAIEQPLVDPDFDTMLLDVPAYVDPGDPPQQGTSARPETFDARFWSVAYRNGRLWATHHVNADPVRARWYEIDMKGWPDSGQIPELIQTGEIDPGSGIHTFFSAISTNDDGDAAITCARSSTSEYISMITAYRHATDDPGTFSEPVIEQTSTGPYTFERWGDYGGVNPDPVESHVFWAYHEYAEGGSWMTWVAKIEVPPNYGDMNCSGIVDFFDISPFVLAITDPAEYEAQYPDCDLMNGDCNDDGSVDFFDIDCFVELVTG